MYQYILLRTLQKKKGDGERSNSGLLDEPTMEAASVTVRSSQDSTIAATANESNSIDSRVDAVLDIPKRKRKSKSTSHRVPSREGKIVGSAISSTFSSSKSPWR